MGRSSLCLTPGSSPLQLRAASEYEERKLIRAAIRKLRAEEIEGEVFSPCLRQGRLLPLPERCWDAASSFLNAFFAFIQLQPWLVTCRATGGTAPSPQPCLQKAARGMMLKCQLCLGMGRAAREETPSFQLQ